MVNKKRFNEVMARAAKLQPQCAMAIDAKTAKVYKEAVKGAVRHHVTGNFARTIIIEDYGKAGGKKVVATDKNAYSIEFGHYMERNAQPGQENEDHDESETVDDDNKTVIRRRERRVKGPGVNPDKHDAKIWVNGTRIMRDATLRAGGITGNTATLEAYLKG